MSTHSNTGGCSADSTPRAINGSADRITVAVLSGCSSSASAQQLREAHVGVGFLTAVLDVASACRCSYLCRPLQLFTSRGPLAELERGSPHCRCLCCRPPGLNSDSRWTGYVRAGAGGVGLSRAPDPFAADVADDAAPAPDARAQPGPARSRQAAAVAAAGDATAAVRLGTEADAEATRAALAMLTTRR